MNVTTIPFDLRGWRHRQRLTQARAADALGLSLPAYCRAEYRCEDRPGTPCSKTLALLCMAIERERQRSAA